MSEGAEIHAPETGFTNTLNSGTNKNMAASLVPTDVLDRPFSEAKACILGTFEHRYLDHLMTKTQGNVTHGAQLAEKERSSLGKLLKKNAIEASLYR